MSLLFLIFAAACANAASLDLRTSCGAKGDGHADDSSALKTCLTQLQQTLDAGLPAVLRIPAGTYLIKGDNGVMPTLTGGAALIGDGPHQSRFVLDRSYEGDLFSWSEAWFADNLASDTARGDKAGAEIIGIGVVGSIDSPPIQNAFVFYDRNDDVIMRDVEVNRLHGQCLALGHTKTVSQAYMRESAFYNVKCFSTGTATKPAVEISSTTTPGSDATNELDFYKLAVFAAPGDGIQVSNPMPNSATRRIRFFGLRIENVGRDGLLLGGSNDQGQIAEISVYDLSVLQAENAALHIGPASPGRAPYLISARGGNFGPGNRIGLLIESGRLVDIELGYIDGPVVRAAQVGTDVNIRSHASGTLN